METKVTSEELQIEILELKKAALLFRAVNNKLRDQILHLLHKNQKLAVTSIYHTLSIEQSVASQHLAILRKANLVSTIRDGRSIYYSINYKKLDELHEYADRLLQYS
jgi:DNA-binding transcriptional ArsR family regulator